MVARLMVMLLLLLQGARRLAVVDLDWAKHQRRRHPAGDEEL